MRWQVGERRQLYRSHWVEFDIVPVVLPDGRAFDHEIVRMPRPGAMTAVVRDRHVLMIFRHRFLNDAWGWELPGGMIEADEQPIVAAAREVEEETGWRPGALRPLTSFRPSSGWSEQRFHLFLGEGATEVGPPTEANEASVIAWRHLDDVRRDLAGGAMPDGLTQFGLAFVLAANGGVELAGAGWGDGGAAEPDEPDRSAQSAR